MAQAAHISAADLDAAVEDRVRARLDELEARYDQRLKELEARLPEDRVTIVCFSGDLDRALAAFVIATGALAMGYQASMYFTFWGLSIIKKQAKLAGKSLMERMFSIMLPANLSRLGLSKMNFAGAGAKMMKSIMAQKNVATLDELMEVAQEMGVRIISCTMAMDIMGITNEEMRDDLDYGSVGTFLGDALKSRATLFI
jgi:peroxiredoxin family protein